MVIVNSIKFLSDRQGRPGDTKWPTSLPKPMYHATIIATVNFKWSENSDFCLGESTQQNWDVINTRYGVYATTTFTCSLQRRNRSVPKRRQKLSTRELPTVPTVCPALHLTPVSKVKSFGCLNDGRSVLLIPLVFLKKSLTPVLQRLHSTCPTAQSLLFPMQGYFKRIHLTNHEFFLLEKP